MTKKEFITLLFLLLFFAEPVFAGYSNYTTQWAVSAIASSQYSIDGWSASQATNEANTFSCGDIETAWAPSTPGTSPEWIKLSYATPVYATEVNIYETYNSGFVYKVELIDENNINYTIWEGTDTTACLGVLNITFSTTSYKVKSVKVHTQKNDFEEIDAVQLKGYQTLIAPATSFYSPSATSSAKRGEAVSFSVNVTNTELSVSSVTAKITPPAGSVFDTALALSSGNASSGIYSGTWTPGNTSAPGTYKIYYYACTSAGCNSSSELSFILNSTLELNATLKSEYLQGEEVQITGYVKDYRGRETAAAAALLLKSSSFSKNFNRSTESSGKFDFSYKISLEDPAGEWTAIINATDGYNNSGNITKTFTVGEPVKVLGYTVDVLEPRENAVLKRGEKIRITAVLKKNGEKISGANVVAKLPSGLLNLEETQPGVYSKEFVVGLGESTGIITLAIEGQKGDLRGTKSISATIKPAELKIEPVLELFYKPGAVEIKAKVSYQDGSAVTGEVFAVINEQKVSLTKKDDFYSGILNLEEGSYSLRFEARDGYGNSGSAEAKLSIGVMSAADYFVKYWYIVAAASGIILLIMHKTGRLSAITRKIRLKRLLSKEKVLEERRKRIQAQYFSEKKMDKHVYDSLINQVDSELLKVRGEMKKLKGK